jgi:hypothetical protein
MPFLTSSHITADMRERVKGAIPTPTPLDHTVIGCIVGVLLFAACIVGAGMYKMHLDRIWSGGSVDVVFNGTMHKIPAIWFRGTAPQNDDEVERLDLVVPLPLSSSESGIVLSPLDKVVLLRIAPSDQSLEPSERPNQLYARFLSGDIWTNPGGLQLRQFEAHTPYEGEELYISQPDGRDFAARCPTVLKQSDTGRMCIWEMRKDGVDVVASFSPVHLTEWENVVTTVHETMSALKLAK